MKVAVVGGGSTYTPELVDGLARQGDRLDVDTVVLHDTDGARLEVVAGASERIMRAVGWKGTFESTTDLARAVDGAAAVLVQIRVGGQAARKLDETLPLRCGCVGQETTGAGGFAKALRTVPVVLDIADAVRAGAADGAWIVDFTNPVGIVTRALLDHGHRAVGLCNVAIGFQRQFAHWLGVSPREVHLGHAGLNHLTWIRSVRVDGDDVLPGLLGAHGDELADEIELPAGLLSTLGAVPSYYLRYFYMHDQVVAESDPEHTRADEVAEIERALLDLYRDPELHTKPELLRQRGGAYYSEAAVQLVAGLFGEQPDPQVVDVRNDGIIDDLPDDAVIEVPARIDRDGAHPLPVPALPPDQAGLVTHVAAYEALAAEAAVTGDHGTAFRALLAHPLVGQADLAGRLLDDLLAANRDHLPRFR